MAAANEAWRTALRQQTVAAMADRVPASVRERNRQVLGG